MYVQCKEKDITNILFQLFVQDPPINGNRCVGNRVVLLRGTGSAQSGVVKIDKVGNVSVVSDGLFSVFV